MSLAGRPKTKARKAHADAVAKARVEYAQAVAPIETEFRKILSEQLAPHREQLQARIREADITYFRAIGDEQSASHLEKEKAA